ncbi:CHAD domain-containing protein [Rhodococcus spelaei]|uniref:CHAD domain-containing protein n=1 Tax=Rhodococcus spelaei TaxID=2546320 RepID=A0A541BMH5_9NOCA|nr:CHAD domain-containing protein [Rhodococcus spelaei]TQF73526.1 CHAD domain-containing protein [Rhodococcus spelaei]
MGNARKRADADAVLDSVRRHSERLTTLADPVRRDEPDAVHQMRVATRRLRSVLGTYDSVFARPLANPVRAELRWLGTVLGDARDEEVLAERFDALLAAQRAELVRGPVRHRLVAAHRTGYRTAHEEVVAALDESRYRDLLAALGELCTGRRPSGNGSVAKSLRRAYRRLDRAGRDAGLRRGSRESGRQPEPELVHAVRKRAKALRYAAEAVADSRPKVVRVAAAAEDLQTVLGEHQDAVVAQRHLLAAADRARAAGEDTFTYGLLTADEAERGRSARTAARDRLRSVRKRRDLL